MPLIAKVYIFKNQIQEICEIFVIAHFFGAGPEGIFRS